MLAALATVLPLAGCASSPAQPIDPRVRAELQATTLQIKAAASSENRSAAEAALQKLTSQVAAAEAGGRINAAFADPILLAANRVAQDIGTLAPPPPVTVTVSPSPSPTPSPTPTTSPSPTTSPTVPDTQDQQWNQDQWGQGNQNQDNWGQGGEDQGNQDEQDNGHSHGDSGRDD
jgi:hypothetical protein